MVLQMARPTKNAKTGVYYFRQKTPADLVAIVGKKEVGWSLGTKDPEQAKVLNIVAVQKQAMIWERYRKRPEPLPHPKIVALSGILYRDYMAALELEPGEPTIWHKALALLDKAPEKPARTERADLATDDPACAPFEAIIASGEPAQITASAHGVSQSWQGRIEAVKPAMGFLNVMTSDFHLHLEGGSVADWQVEPGRRIALDAAGQPTGLSLSGAAFA